MENGVMMQYFEWYLPRNCGLWNQLKNDAPKLAEKGITAVWLPPAYKGLKGDDEVGYGVYDLYDLGEFEQKGSVATKYGTKDEYLAAIKACQDAGIKVYADIVLNQMLEGDKLEYVEVQETNPENRNEIVPGTKWIKAYSKFTFPGRNGKYDDSVWDHSDFSGCDIDERTGKHGVFLFDGAKWSDKVDDENGNYDYLLGMNLDHSNPKVIEKLIKWGKWYVDTTHVDGFRLDAVKHIDRDFFPMWLNEMRTYTGGEMFSVGEYWKGDVGKLTDYLDATGRCMSLFDVPLHYAFHNISGDADNYSMADLFSNTLVREDPVHAVTFIDNHDTQPGQALESCVQEWFIPHAYAAILLRKEGFPCIFYGDYYGLEAREGRAYHEIIDRMLDVRKNRLYGKETDYFDDRDVVGWTVSGDETHPDSGAAVVMTAHCGGTKQMNVGASHAGEIWIDASGNTENEVLIDENGDGEFSCADGSVSFYVKKTSRKGKGHARSSHSA